MTLLDEEFDELGEDELALLTRRFKRLHKNRVNTRKNPRTCFQCGKPGHFIAGLSGKDGEQGRLQEPVEDGRQVPIKA
jgi:hypothetical protein